VLDDIPRLTGGDIFVEYLARLGFAAQKSQVQIVSTSQFELPARLRSQFATGWIREQLAPPFTDAEAGELFRAHGAPESFLSDPRLQFLNRLAAGHPLLLAAVAEFLVGRGWSYREEEIDGLLRGDHTEAIIPEVVERLTRTLGDPPRELLYRLTLPLGGFTQADVSAVADVAPIVDRPRERLSQLLGAWVQRDTEIRFEVSPLVRPLGRTEIREDVREGCYRSLANVITRQRVMNPVQCDRAIFYNLGAREHARAITLYLVLLVEVLRSRPPKQIAPLIDRWRHEPLPPDLGVANRLFVRAYQLAAFTQCKLDTRFVVEDIDVLLGQATVADGWAIVGLAIQSLTGFRTMDPGRVLRYVRAAVELPVILGPHGQEMVFETVSIPSLLWMLVTDLRTPALIGQWLDAVAALPEPQYDPFWSSHLAQQGVWLVGNKAYLTECEKPAARQDWARLLRALGDQRKRAEPIGQPRLEAALTGVMLEILGDRKWLDQAPDIAQETLSRWPDNPDVQFEVRGTWGRQHAYQKRPDLALPLLNAALSQPHTPHDYERLRCLLAASICVSANDLRYAEQARDLARSSAHAPDIDAARALGEYAISVHQARGGQDGAVAACPAWSEAMRRFFGARRKDMFWRDLFPLFAHATSYLHGMAREGRPPEHACDGGEFAVPSRGFLMKDYMAEREALYREGGMAAVAWIMQSYAAASGAAGEADHWMRFAIKESRRVGASYILAATGTDAAGVLLADGKFEDAVEVGVFGGRGSVVHRAAADRRDGNFEGIGVDVSDEFRSLPDDRRRLGDQFAAISGLVPAAIAVGGLSRTDPEAAASAARRVGRVCRDLADSEPGDRELWQVAADLFELTANTPATSGSITARTRRIEGDGERELALRLLGYILATAHAGPEEGLSYQLGMIEALLRWYPAPGAVNRHLLVPYIEAYWRFAARNSRFVFRAPTVTAAAIESALGAPEPERVYAVLSAAASGFSIRGARDVLQRLRDAVPPMSNV
jgi:hypothetical protein